MIFCIVGKTGSGKDSIVKAVIESTDLKPIIMYTTRPMRAGEVNGKEYYFRTEEQLAEDIDSGNILEMRTYDTVKGLWRFYTMITPDVDYKSDNYITMGPAPYMSSLMDKAEEWGIPVKAIYLSVNGGVRIQRLVDRESLNETPNFIELCRRYVADEIDFRPYKNFPYDFVINNTDDMEESIDSCIEFLQECGVRLSGNKRRKDIQEFFYVV